MSSYILEISRSVEKEDIVVRVAMFQNQERHQHPHQRRRYDDPDRDRMNYLRSILHNLAY